MKLLMQDAANIDRDGARAAATEQITGLLHDGREEVLLGLLDNPDRLDSPFLNEGQVLKVLARINAPSRIVVPRCIRVASSRSHTAGWFVVMLSPSLANRNVVSPERRVGWRRFPRQRKKR